MATEQDYKVLWGKAVDQYIDSTSRTPQQQDLLKELESVQDLEAHLEKHREKFAGFRKKHGKLTGRLKKALRPVTVLSNVASSAIGLSPFAPASTIFGAVLFVVQAASEVSDVYDWIDQLFDKLGDFTVRLDEYCKEGIIPSLGTKVVQILVCLLEILARSENKIKTGRWREYLAVVFLGKDEQIKASFDKLSKLLESEQRLVSAIAFATNQRMDKRIEEIEQTGKDTLEAAKKAEIGVDEIQQRELRDKILSWISSTDFPSKQSDVIDVRQKGTGKWFLEHPKFESWISGSKSTLICPGMPGAGKTMVAAIAIDHLSRTIQNDEIGVAYIYCSYQLRENQTTTLLLGALLRQLVQARKVIPKSVLRLYEHCSKWGTRPSGDEIFDNLKSVIGDFSNVYVVIDALDECLDAKNNRVQLLAPILDLQRENASLKLMVTSRYIPEIEEEEFEHAIKLDVQAGRPSER